MAIEILLPKLGLTMEEGTVDEWLVPDGTVVVVPRRSPSPLA